MCCVLWCDVLRVLGCYVSFVVVYVVLVVVLWCRVCCGVAVLCAVVLCVVSTAEVCVSNMTELYAFLFKDPMCTEIKTE